MTDPSENIKLPINEPANGKRKSQIQAPAPPPSRTKWTRRVPHPVLIGHAAC